MIENNNYSNNNNDNNNNDNNNYNNSPNGGTFGMFQKLINKIDDIGLELDNYPIKLYNVKYQFEIFNKQFRDKISKLYGYDVSQGGIKMNEMISTFKDLVPTDKEVVKSFHICEAREVLYMLRFYVKDILKHRLEWKSQY